MTEIRGKIECKKGGSLRNSPLKIHFQRKAKSILYGELREHPSASLLFWGPEVDHDPCTMSINVDFHDFL